MLGDPHPGNYRLCADDSVAFFDFGMLRPLPRGYLAREAAVSRAVSAGDEQAVIGGMHALGYLPGDPGDWDAGLFLEYMRALSWWLNADGPLRLAPGTCGVLRSCCARPMAELGSRRFGT